MNHRHDPHTTTVAATLARPVIALLTPLALLTLLAGAPVTTAQVTLVTHDSFALPEALIASFEADTGTELRLLTGGDAGSMVNRALLTAPRPLADAMFGIDDALFAREGAAELFEPYDPPGLEQVPADLRFATEVTPVTVGYVAFNYDSAAFAAGDPPPPSDLTDLTQEAYRGLTVVSDPATSSPGLAFLLTTIDRFGEGHEGDWLDFWADLRDADLQVVSGWTEAYYTWFSRYGGDRPIVLSYLSSPAAEAIFADPPLAEGEAAPTTSLLCERCVWRQIEAAGVLAGSERPEAARRVVDMLLSAEVQAAVPEAMFVYPARSDVALPEAFDLHAPLPEPKQVASLPGERIAASQARWLQQWTQVVRQGRDPAEVR